MRALAAAIALALAASGAADGDGDGAFVADFDWLTDEFWREEFRDGMLTLNAEDLKRFVATGTAGGSYRVGQLVVERFNSVSLSADEDADVDIPASVVVSIAGEVVVGAKGLDFDTSVEGNRITISHWNGEGGCSVSKWFIKHEVESVEYDGSRYEDLVSGKPCSRT